MSFKITKEGNRRRCVHKIVSDKAPRPFRSQAYCGRQVRVIYTGEVNCKFCLKRLKQKEYVPKWKKNESK